jgi:hypothetical protein
MEYPKLIEPNIKYFTKATLKQCKLMKQKYFSIVVNIACFLLLIVVGGGLLVYKYKGKLSPLEKEVKTQQHKHYIFSKIKQYQDIKAQSNHSLITDLPKY